MSSSMMMAPIQPGAGEIATTAAAANAAAIVQAQYMVAMARPRKAEVVRASLMKECRKPTFANEAIYAKPVGGDTIRGLSIRFAEAARQMMGNVRNGRMTLYETDERKVVRVSVMDLETNSTEEREVSVKKIVERKRLRRNETAIEERINSKGETTYIVKAGEDELLTRENALCAKAERECTLKLLPPDLKAEAFEVASQTILSGMKGSVDEKEQQRRNLIDAFSDHGVGPEHLTTWLGHPISQINEKEFFDLRLIFNGLKDGSVTWAAVMESRGVVNEAEAEAKEEAKTKTSRTADALKQRKRRPAKQAAAPVINEEAAQVEIVKETVNSILPGAFGDTPKDAEPKHNDATGEVLEPNY